jgi:hypothetical protein
LTVPVNSSRLRSYAKTERCEAAGGCRKGQVVIRTIAATSALGLWKFLSCLHAAIAAMGCSREAAVFVTICIELLSQLKVESRKPRFSLLDIGYLVLSASEGKFGGSFGELHVIANLAQLVPNARIELLRRSAQEHGDPAVMLANIQFQAQRLFRGGYEGFCPN